MSPDTIVAGGVNKSSQPRSTPQNGGRFSVRYEPTKTVMAFNVEASVPPPEDLLLDIEIASENGAYFLRAVEVDVAVEEDDPQEAFRSLVEAVKGWLEYLEEEKPVLAPDLEPQRHYTHLLRYAPHTWFGRLLMDQDAPTL